MSRPRLLALLLAFITLAAFLPATRFAFVNYDDNDYVTANPPVQQGLTWAGVKWAFTTYHASNWHPLTWISHMLDCTLFGLNPGGHHLVNVLFHTANTVLLFGLLLRLTGALWPAAFVAALFAWHPLHVESVAWIAERKDVLSTFFALLTLLAYAKFVAESKAQSPKAKVFFALSLLAFAFGLLAKPMLVTLPFVLLLLDFWPLARVAGVRLKVAGSEQRNLQLATFQLQLWEKWPFFFLTALSCALTLVAQSQVVHGGAAVATLNMVPLHYRLENMPVAYVEYLLKLIWPSPLAVFYPLADRIPLARVAGAAGLLLALSGGVWRGHRAQPYLLVGWLWFLGTLVPVIGLVQVGGAALADRYSYFSSIGIFIIVAFGANEMAKKFSGGGKFLAGAALIVLASCLGATEKQLGYWRDSETLFRHDLAVTADNDIARNNLANALEHAGDLPAALVEAQAAVKLAPERAALHINLGNLLARSGRHPEALAAYSAAIQRQPREAGGHLGAGDELTMMGDYPGALKEFAAAARLETNSAAPHIGSARVFFMQGRDAEAVEELRAALRCAPNDAENLAAAARFLAVNENAAARDEPTALALASKATALSGANQPVYFDVLGMACAANGDFTNAEICAQNALTLARAMHLRNTEAIQQRLDLYKKNQPWRESFRVPNAPVKN
jgi:tetratricopeptide (TPR) repeat protein